MIVLICTGLVNIIHNVTSLHATQMVLQIHLNLLMQHMLQLYHQLYRNQNFSTMK